MSRPRKRPRLQFMGSVSPNEDVDLVRARRRNDCLFKSNLERVFQKYERDFTGMGDEIGQVSGMIEIDNGHLRSLFREKQEEDSDVDETQQSPHRVDGRRMLRAMTAAPSEYSSSISDADEVLQSVEANADTEMLSAYSSEDDLFGTNPTCGDGDEDELLSDQEVREAREEEAAIKSESDDLFYIQPANRSPSVDSLFNPRPEDTSTQLNLSNADSLSVPVMKKEIVDSTTIREEVRKILLEEKEQEKEMVEAKIEAAWRIPIRLPSSPPVSALSTNIPRIVSSDRSPAESPSELDETPTMVVGSSLWATRVRRPKKIVVAERILKRIRAESEDPLQEGFSSEPETSSRQASARTSVRRTATPPKKEEPFSRRCSSSGPSTIRALPLLNTEDDQPALRRSLRRRRLTQRAAVWLSAAEIAPTSTGDTSGDVEPHERTRHSNGVQDSSPRPENGESADHRNQQDRAADTLPIEEAMNQESGGDNSSDEYKTLQRPIKRKRRRANLRTATRSGPRVSQVETPEIKNRHPWQVPKTRSGRPISELSASLRRNAIEKYVEAATAGSLGNIVFPPAEGRVLDSSPIVTTAASAERQQAIEAMKEGICFYCKVDFRRNSVGSHWDRVLTNHAAQETVDIDDPHDIAFLLAERSKVERRSRPAKTLVEDFRLMVELHEGGDLSFDQIASSKLLWSCKQGAKLEAEYYNYRQSCKPGTQRQWTTEQEHLLWQLVEDMVPKTTMIMLWKQMGRLTDLSFVDLGNKLADGFLTAYRSRVDDPFSDQLRMYGDRESQCREDRDTLSNVARPPAVGDLGEEMINLGIPANTDIPYESDDDLFRTGVVHYRPRGR